MASRFIRLTIFILGTLALATFIPFEQSQLTLHLNTSVSFFNRAVI